MFFGKLVCLILLLNFVLGSYPLVSPRRLMPVLLIVVLACRCRVRSRTLLRKNYFIFAFAVIFSGFSVFSGILRGGIEWTVITATFYKIILVYNIVYLFGIWMGKNGFLRILSVLPGRRIRLFLILFHRTVYSFMNKSKLVLFQVRSRLELTTRDRLIIARYYIQNLLLKELYSFHYYQAALHTRVHHDVLPYSSPEKISSTDPLLIGLVIVIYAFSFFF